MTKPIAERLKEWVEKSIEEETYPSFVAVNDLKIHNIPHYQHSNERDLFNYIADEIEREQNEIYDIRVNDIVKMWAKLHDMPMKENETITQWLDRWTIMLPRYEDDEPVQSGNEFVVDLCDGKEVVADANYIVASLDGSCVYLLNDYSGYMEDSSYRFKRSALKILDADGVELKVGEKPFSKRYGTQRKEIKSIHRAGDKNYYGHVIDKDFVIYVDNEFDYADNLTHCEPDSLEKLRDDIANRVIDKKCPSYQDEALRSYADRLTVIIERGA